MSQQTPKMEKAKKKKKKYEQKGEIKYYCGVERSQIVERALNLNKKTQKRLFMWSVERRSN